MTLGDADQAAQRQQSRVPGAAVQPCPLVRVRIRVRIIGEDAEGLDGIAAVLSSPDGHELRSRTGPDGVCLFDGLDPGIYQLGLPLLDQDAWQVLSLAQLAPQEARSDILADWKPAMPADLGAPVQHKIVDGECGSMLAYRHGLLPTTVWEHEANTALRDSRESLYILAAGDLLTVPARRPRMAEVAAGSDVTLRRLGVPERLRIRFLSFDDSPRAGLSYLLTVESESGAVVPVRSGLTDEDGFVDAGIPPDAVTAEIVLGYGNQRETHRFALGKAAPITTVQGWQTRLANLGYYTGDHSGVLNPGTKLAIAQFQRDRALPPSGEMDGPTAASLAAFSLS
ncbi:peptidoglycan-binding protein [Pseudoduganella sp. UC29_71]|uniref:peptidoglycan-binding domain-containing protein n=1 Tax=Pseudoduganella sp. UC29_71 TaxID=3350174 RepID=UPI00366FEED1